MLIIPAVDIRNGKCVRLTHGEVKNETVYFDDPVTAAKMWEDKGARRIHVVDLDGAFDGLPKNIDVVGKIRKAVSVEIEFGGGVRSIETIDKLFDMGINFVILGTIALKEPKILAYAIKKYKSKIIVGVDAKDGFVAVSGWIEKSKVNAVDFSMQLKAKGVEQIIFTDISKDGALRGPNLEALKNIAEKSCLKVTASGGVSSIDDIKRIKALEKYGVNSVILGKALFEGCIKLDEAIKECI